MSLGVQSHLEYNVDGNTMFNFVGNTAVGKYNVVRDNLIGNTMSLGNVAKWEYSVVGNMIPLGSIMSFR